MHSRLFFEKICTQEKFLITLKKVSVFCIKEEKDSIFLALEALPYVNERRAGVNGDGAISGDVDLFSLRVATDFNG